jgi:hypothetical protein
MSYFLSVLVGILEYPSLDGPAKQGFKGEHTVVIVAGMRSSVLVLM